MIEERDAMTKPDLGQLVFYWVASLEVWRLWGRKVEKKLYICKLIIKCIVSDWRLLSHLRALRACSISDWKKVLCCIANLQDVGLWGWNSEKEARLGLIKLLKDFSHKTFHTTDRYSMIASNLFIFKGMADKKVGILCFLDCVFDTWGKCS